MTEFVNRKLSPMDIEKYASAAGISPSMVRIEIRPDTTSDREDLRVAQESELPSGKKEEEYRQFIKDIAKSLMD